MEDLAKIKIENGTYTAAQISINPTLVYLNIGERLCYKCGLVKYDEEFRKNRKQCNKCRYKKRNQFKQDFEEVIEDQINIIKESMESDILNNDEKKAKIEIYTKDQIHSIAQKLGIKRKFSDNLAEMREKVFNYYIH
jgi:acetyl-CoA carboxylase beta subunit